MRRRRCCPQGRWSTYHVDLQEIGRCWWLQVRCARGGLSCQPPYVAGSGGAGHQGADLARKRPCRYGEPATFGIGASLGLELADESLVVGLGVQGASPLAHQLCGHEWMQHRRLLRSGVS
jgi:hypothetical protein